MKVASEINYSILWSMDAKRVYSLYILCIWCLITPHLFAQTVSDPNFEVKIDNPLYPDQDGPLILYDTNHHNAFSLTGQYKTFADIVRAEGYQLRDQSAVISKEALSKAKLFVTANALSHPSNWDLPNASIYSEEEIELLYKWVHDEGGGLFIITDHMPCAGAVSELAARFGFNMMNGFTDRLDGGAELFNDTLGNLLPTAVTNMEGRKVNQIRCWGGGGFIPPKEAVVFSRLGKEYRVYFPTKVKDMETAIRDNIPYIFGQHLANGAILNCGKGRVCIFADAAPFTALLQGINSKERGMNHPDARDHVHLLRNILQWLHR